MPLAYGKMVVELEGSAVGEPKGEKKDWAEHKAKDESAARDIDKIRDVPELLPII